MNQDTGKLARNYFDQKFHCAESMCRAMLEQFSDDPATRARYNSCAAFGGGVGKTHKEVCGLVSGGLVALGILHGRTDSSENWDKLAETAKTFREAFVQEFGSCNCGELLAKYGKQESMDKCKAMTEQAAPILEQLLKKYAK